MSGAADAASEQSIAWMVLAQSGRMSAPQERQFADWLQADALNRQAWQRLQDCFGAQCQTLRSLDRRAPQAVGEARQLLLEPGQSRRQLLRGMLGLGVGAAALWSASRCDTAQSLLADFSTATGKRQLFILEDGSRLHLNAASAVDYGHGASGRDLRLLQGQLLLEVAADSARPFVVRTDDASVCAAASHLLVSREPFGTRVVALRNDATVSGAGGQSQALRQGQGVLVERDAIRLLAGDQRHQADWLQGRLSVIDEPLDAVINALRPYLPGLVHVTPQARNVSVQGVFPLDTPQEALTLLAETLAIEVRRFGPWLTWIGTPA